MQFDMFLEDLIFEAMNTKILFDPIKFNDSYVEMFDQYNIPYQIEANLVNFNEFSNILDIVIRQVNRDMSNPIVQGNYSNETYGIVLNWTIDLLNSKIYETIEHIVISSIFNKTDKTHELRGRTYGKIMKKFLEIRPDYVENHILAETYMPNNLNDFDKIPIFALSKLKNPS